MREFLRLGAEQAIRCARCNFLIETGERYWAEGDDGYCSVGCRSRGKIVKRQAL